MSPGLCRVPRRASIVDMAVRKGSRHTYLLTQGRLGQPGQRHGKGFAMVCTTLNFAEKYLLKTEVRSVAGMSGGTSDAGTDFDVDFGGEGDLGSDHATGFNRSLSADDYWAAAGYADESLY